MMRHFSALLFLAIGCSGCSASNRQATAAAADSPTVSSPGKKVFDKWCADCHAPGPRYPGTASLAAKYGKDLPAALEERKDLTPETVAYFVRHGVSIMPPARKTEISDAELRALGEYLSAKKGK